MPSKRTGEHPAVADSVRMRELIADITRRLRPVCGHMPDAEFEAMVRKAAQATLRWEANTAHSRPGPSSRDDGQPTG